MHPKFLALTVATAFFANTAVAQDASVLDLSKVCESGCVIEIAFDDSARIGAGTNVSGMFKIGATANIMSFFDGLTVTDTGLTIYQLTSEPGMPMFTSIELVKDYMDGVDELIGRNKPAS